MESLPWFVSTVFVLTTFLTVLLFYRAAHYSGKVLLILLPWLVVQAAIAYSGFYLITTTIPPRIALMGPPALAFFIGMFVSRSGRSFIDQLDVKTLTLLHVVRLPVELVLWWLCVYKAVPQIMTFEGRNFDILAGISAPVIYYFGFVRKSLGRTFILAWNVLCLGLLLNIIFHAVLSVRTPFQLFGMDQPNVAILYFPFIWLPACVVPLVMLSHLAAIRKLVSKSN
jgi:hypothetical protein